MLGASSEIGTQWGWPQGGNAMRARGRRVAVALAQLSWVAALKCKLATLPTPAVNRDHEAQPLRQFRHACEACHLGSRELGAPVTQAAFAAPRTRDELGLVRRESQPPLMPCAAAVGRRLDEHIASEQHRKLQWRRQTHAVRADRASCESHCSPAQAQSIGSRRTRALQSGGRSWAPQRGRTSSCRKKCRRSTDSDAFGQAD
eukprot:2734151-Prymnesium_polylepis.2